MDIVSSVTSELGLKNFQVENVIKLIDDGATVPFIARYRKEATGSLDEEKIRDIWEKVSYGRNLEKRKEEITALIDEQGKLSEELKEAITKALKLQELEDIYLPYKKKKKTKADIAKDNGLEPLSVFVKEFKGSYSEFEIEAEKYINENVIDTAAAIEGAKLIIAQEMSENAQNREYIRSKVLEYGVIKSKVNEKNILKDEKKVYLDYYEYEEKLLKAASHRVLAVNRGEKEEILKVYVEIDDKTKDQIIQMLVKSYKNIEFKQFFNEIAVDGLDRLIFPSIEREVRNIITEKAEEEAIKMFKKNLNALLLQPPILGKAVLGLDPGYRTGCKMVIINKEGFYVDGDVLYITHSQGQLDDAKKKLKKIIAEHEIDIIAIGNGTASRETEKFAADLLKEIKSERKVSYIIVSEAGASVYSASKLAKEEFPDLDVTARGAISIARRVQDPLAELVKIDPESIGVGMYQHDINQGRLKEALGDVVESAVNNVGVNVNSASWALLGYVSGINKNVAKNIVEHRNKIKKFNTKNELLKVKGIGEKAYEQCVGFLRIKDGNSILDNTAIHPEDYEVTAKLQKNYKVEEIKDFEKVSNEINTSLLKLKDIVTELLKPGYDVRTEFNQVKFANDILDINDLKEGYILSGIVRNITDFGAFVDIGLKNDALLHISQISEKRISHPSEVLSINQNLENLKVINVDLEKQRVGLSLKN